MNCIVNYSDSSDEEENSPDSSPKRDKGCLAVAGQSESEGKLGSESLSESRDQRNDTEPASKRLKIVDEEFKPHDMKCSRLRDGNPKEQLRLPSAIQSMFAVRKDEKFICFVKQLLGLFEPLIFEMLPEFHISLSRTVVIRHHWIDPLVHSLKDKLSSRKSCVGDLDDIKFYSNDEKTRTFLCLEVSKEDTAFDDYVSVVDKCFSEFKLPKYYENPSFHISLAWCLGNVCESVPKEKLEKAKEMLVCFCAANPELSVVFAQNICCRSGNKSFVIPLV